MALNTEVKHVFILHYGLSLITLFEWLESCSDFNFLFRWVIQQWSPFCLCILCWMTFRGLKKKKEIFIVSWSHDTNNEFFATLYEDTLVLLDLNRTSAVGRSRPRHRKLDDGRLTKLIVQTCFGMDFGLPLLSIYKSFDVWDVEASSGEVVWVTGNRSWVWASHWLIVFSGVFLLIRYSYAPILQGHCCCILGLAPPKTIGISLTCCHSHGQ